MIKIILIALVVVIVVFLIVAALQPADFRIVRSITISAPPAVPFSQVNDLHKWQEMSPYTKLDPAATYTFDGPPSGTGASLAWTGNNQIGQGRMTIVESRPTESVRFKLEFIKPFVSTSAAEFTFVPNGNQTVVTWSMTGRKNFMTKAIGLIMNMDRMLGDQFEEGLAKLKRLAEAPARPSRR